MLQAQKKNDWEEKNVWTEPHEHRHDAFASDSDADNKWPDLIQFDDESDTSLDDGIESSDYDADCEDNNNNINTDNSDKCPICLVSQIGAENRAYASACFHKFCLKCLREWSQVRPTCPLCARPFERIVYSCLSSTDFKEWYVKPREGAGQELVGPLTPPGSPDSGYNSTATRKPSSLSKASWIVGKQCAPVAFRALVYANEWYVDPTMCQQSREQDVVTYSSQLVLCQERFRSKLASPQWYRDNEPLLMSWLARELCALALVANNGNSQVSKMLVQLEPALLTELLDKLVQLLLVQLLDRLVSDDEDLSAVRTVAELLHVPRRVARHFVHELTFFLATWSSATHGLDMVEYDARAVYFERPKAMNRKRFLSPLMLPVDTTKYRLLPAAEERQDLPHERVSVQFGVDMARNFVAAGLDKEDYVKRILMLQVEEKMDEEEEKEEAPAAVINKRNHEEMCSTDSMASSLSSSSSSSEDECISNMTESFDLLSDDDDVLVLASWPEPPVPPPPSPAVQQQQRQLRGPSASHFRRTSKRTRRFASSD